MADEEVRSGMDRRQRRVARRRAARARRQQLSTTFARQRAVVARPIRDMTEPAIESYRAVLDAIRARRRWTYPVLAVAAIAVAAVLPLLPTWFTLPLWMEQGLNGAALARFALFALFALGLNVVVGFAGLLDLGYVAFWAIGAYTAAVLTGAAKYSIEVSNGTATLADKPVWAGWMWFIIPVALLVAVIAGIVLGSPTLRLRGDYLAIVTLGFGEIVRIFANNMSSLTNGPRGNQSIPHPALHVAGKDIVWGIFTDNKYYWLFLAFVIVWIVAITLLDRSRIGRAWVAIREDEVAAAAMGVPVVRMKLAAFAIGACTAGVGGVIYAEQVNFINPPTFTVIQSILILAMVVIGGMGSIPGAILGAALVALLPEVFRSFSDYRFFVFGFALVAVMGFRPQGLLPSKRRQLELHGHVREDSLGDLITAEADAEADA
ncbi:MAG TPA: branched-chain amino acid ABC transporter permease [Coriobacteriia bacterium]